MRYKILQLIKNGPYDYTLQVEEVVSVWSRFFHSSAAIAITVKGDGRGFWESDPFGIPLSKHLVEFADEQVRKYPNGYRLRVRL